MAMGQKLGNALKAWTGATEWLAANVRSNLSGVTDRRRAFTCTWPLP